MAILFSGAVEAVAEEAVDPSRQPTTPGDAGVPYDRDDWPHWEDADGDCQNTRAEVLIRDSQEPVEFKREARCIVVRGLWVGPYTGEKFTVASDVDIDHLVPLSHAHQTGGVSWSLDKKKAFANDPANLLTVDDATNQGKGNKGPARWRPPLQAFWCEYAQRWRGVKATWGLVSSDTEQVALSEMEQECR